MNHLRRVPAVCLALAFVLSGSVALAQAPASPAPKPSTAERCAAAAFSTIFRCIPHDLRNIVRSPSVNWLVAGGALAAGSVLLDDEVKGQLADDDRDPSVKIGADLGHAGLQFGAPFAAYLIAKATGSDEAADVSVVWLRAQVVNGVVTRSLKMIPRARPYQESATPTKGSFPSGHTSAAFATATVFQRRWGWRVGLPSYAVAGFIGATRLERDHYLSDVMFGAALGIASAMAVDVPVAHGRIATVAPLLSRDAAGVSVEVATRRR